MIGRIQCYESYVHENANNISIANRRYVGTVIEMKI